MTLNTQCRKLEIIEEISTFKGRIDKVETDLSAEIARVEKECKQRLKDTTKSFSSAMKEMETMMKEMSDEMKRMKKEQQNTLGKLDKMTEKCVDLEDR